MSESGKGRIFSEEHKRKISEALKGKIVSVKARINMSRVRKGKHFSPKTEFKKVTQVYLRVESILMKLKND